MTDHAKLVEQARRLFERNENRDRHFGDDLADAIESLVKERNEALEELDTWKSVFPDIAPNTVLPDSPYNMGLREGREAGIREAAAWCRNRSKHVLDNHLPVSAVNELLGASYAILALLDKEMTIALPSDDNA